MTDNLASNEGWKFYEKIYPGDCLRQGDLIGFNDDNSLRKYGLVVTADCDLEKRKHGRLITLVPIISAETVVEYYLLLEQLDRQHDNLASYARKQFNVNGDISDPIVVAELRSKIDSAQSDPSMHLPWLAAKSILNDLDKISARDFCNLMAALNLPTSKMPQKIENQIKDKGDLILLPRPSFLDNSVSIAWVRQIWQVPMRNIVLCNSEIKETLGARIARLDSPYRYRVTQVMSQVFSDIGTPDVEHDLSTVLNGVFP